MIRDTCVICNSKHLEPVHTLHNFPLYTHTAITPFDMDEYGDLIFVACTNCSTVQLRDLVDPSELYKFSHNLTFNSPTWAKHHAEFAEFILSRQFESITEIGGSSGALAREILHCKPAPYLILDLCNSPPDVSGITFQHGNCESYTYKANSTVVLSHVFEHLYQPRKFVEQLAKNNVSSVILSIPDMKHWLNTNVLSFIHREHTFYCDTEILNYLFESFGYTCVLIKEFNNHSIFYRFEQQDRTPSIPYRPELVSAFKDYFAAREQQITSVDISGIVSIFPAGHYGQLVYYYLSNKNIIIKNFYDNDKSKQGGRVYGTNSLVKSPTELSGIQAPENILLCASIYNDEISRGLLSINPRLHISKL